MCQCAGASITILGYLSAANWLTKNQHCGTKKIKGKVWFLTLNLIFIIQTNFTGVRLGDIFQLSFRLFSHPSTSTYVWCRSLQGCKYKIIFIKNCCSWKSIVILMKNELSKIWNVLKCKKPVKRRNKCTRNRNTWGICFAILQNLSLIWFHLPILCLHKIHYFEQAFSVTGELFWAFSDTIYLAWILFAM